ncbi:uncharacterized protein K02A2.6-like [Morus notabilis]|uniref:uncharacterized protein K02A2.6-like n=1 Tax=Morus notabilis TaxID=981085 RepID=UPI000CED09B7|nr:uncharacterized protein K02A2.6-like [Morus notabilis]
MEGIDSEIICHSLNIDPSYPPKRQKRRPMNPERYEALKKEVDKLINNGFIREAHYPRWVSNPVLVVKPNGSWKTCVDFNDLNKACPKDGFLLPQIDQMVDATAGHEMLNFMDAYSGYNQIPMHPADEEHTSFITNRDLYCYKVMPFGLKNAGATYKRLVNKMFAQQLKKSMEVYVDDMLVKSARATQHVDHLGEMFGILRKYHMKLNPQKCAFGVGSGKFLRFMASNNEAEYEALIAELRLASHLKIERLNIFNDSQLIVGQVKEEYQARGEKIGAYLRKVKEELVKFKNYEMLHIPRAKNANADTLAKLASSKDSDALGVIPIEELERPTIKKIIETLIIQTGESWMTPLVQYLMDAKLQNNKYDARRIRYRAAIYLLYDGLLYRRGYSTHLQRCLDNNEAQKVLQEIHERCQRYATIPGAPPENLTSILSPWPFAKCGVDLIGPLHLAPGGFKFAIIAVDYYIKWAEAKALTTTTEAACTNFMWNNIVCRFGVPHSIVSDNGKQFDNASTRRFCDSLGIRKDLSAPIHP